MPIPDPSAEGTVPFGEWRTWYRVTGELDSPKPPLVVLHGGPGAAHNYTLRIARLAERGRPVVHYDQLGVGNSTHLPERGADFWTVELFLNELDNLLGQLGIGERYHLLGQSWGGMLGAEHAVRRPTGLGSLVLANSPASDELWIKETARIRTQLPNNVQQTLAKHEAQGTTDHADYKAAVQVYNQHFVCRLVPTPPEVLASDAATDADPTVYHTMNGPSEFHVIGTLRDWTIIDRAARINVPTLLINGRYDEATTATMQPFDDLIPDVRWEVFEESSHMPHIEEEERYLAVVGDFLDAQDRAMAPA
ncbi:alpha/beta fold hydrolase [Leekyejoonella antrihumi]|uniref:Proline iminopeptidase n=2 Tax=Leekyejoonella antrihumi TaxID=1660198 RepID=A0A563E007_9MICO|nr:alpha/beta fold hydrolase [Leekyejoonella antrihumi]